MVLGPL